MREAVIVASARTPLAKSHRGSFNMTQEWSAAYLAGDAAAVANLYTEDAAQVQATGDWIRGRDAIAKRMQAQFDTVTATAREDITQEVIPAGDYVVEVGNYSYQGTTKAGNKPVGATGRYMVLWRKDADGAWRLLRDIGAEAPAKPQPLASERLLCLTLTLLQVGSVAGQQEGPPATPTRFTMWATVAPITILSPVAPAVAVTAQHQRLVMSLRLAGWDDPCDASDCWPNGDLHAARPLIEATALGRPAEHRAPPALDPRRLRALAAGMPFGA